MNPVRQAGTAVQWIVVKLPAAAAAVDNRVLVRWLCTGLSEVCAVPGAAFEPAAPLRLQGIPPVAAAELAGLLNPAVARVVLQALGVRWFDPRVRAATLQEHGRRSHPPPRPCHPPRPHPSLQPPAAHRRLRFPKHKETRHT